MTALRWTTGLALVLTTVLIVLGAWVRATGSGLSCPDWPTCYGHLVPLPSDIPPEAGYSYFQVMLEWVHRLIAGVFLGPLILAIGFLCWRARRAEPRLPWYGGLLVLLLLVQAGLGGVTVLDQNSPWSVALHLGTALLLFSVLWLIFVRTSGPAPDLDGRGRAIAAFTWAVALGAMVSAAVMTKSGASLACGSWPLCNQGLVPDLGDPGIVMNVTHRVLAALSILGLAGLWSALRGTSLQPVASVALVLGIVEILFGGLVVALQVPVWAGVGHQALGVLTFGAIAWLMWRCQGAAARATLEDPRHVGLSRA